MGAVGHPWVCHALDVHDAAVNSYTCSHKLEALLLGRDPYPCYRECPILGTVWRGLPHCSRLCGST